MTERLTAIDIEKQDFPKKVRGFDPQEVRMYLKTVSEDFERLTDYAAMPPEADHRQDDLSPHQHTRTTHDLKQHEVSLQSFI